MESSTVQPATSQLIAGSRVTGSLWKAMLMAPPDFGVPVAAPVASPPPDEPPQPATAAAAPVASSTTRTSSACVRWMRQKRLRGRPLM